MATPTQEEIKSFGELIKPFQRNKRGKTIKKDLKPAHKIKSKESGIGDKIYDATDDGIPHHPQDIQFVTEEIIVEIESRKMDIDKKKLYCFLWVLDEGGLKILWENVENPLDIEDGAVKHTNINEAGLAFHGGELFFASDNKIFVNNRSDRYGDSERKHWDAVIAYYIKTYSEYQIKDLKPIDV